MFINNINELKFYLSNVGHLKTMFQQTGSNIVAKSS